MTARLVEAGNWVFFDVHARSAASGAHVAMALRVALPGTTIRSEPDGSRSPDELRPHLLHCRASMPAHTTEQTRAMLETALESIDALQASGEEPPVRVVFRDDTAAAAAHAA